MSHEIKIETATPKLFTKRAIAAINAYSIFAIVPILVAIPLIALVEKLFRGSLAFGLGFAILGVAVVLPVYFFPIVIGNPHVRRLVHLLNASDQKGFIIQLANLPRAKSGFWAFMEDADDVGLLSFESESLIFHGDSTEFEIPFSMIKNVRKKNVGWRGLWVYGHRIIIELSEPTFLRSIEVAERSSLSIPASRRITKELFRCLLAQSKK